jgi:O-acetyl-ADP-ribose deacetylase (regulator of RNase III)
MDLFACQGNIADEAADLLVSPADPGLSMSGGAAAALQNAAGDTLKSAVADHDQVEVGSAVLTPTSELFADYVAHAVATPMFEPATEATVRDAVQAALSKGVEEGCDSIVFPLIGSGIGGIQDEASARIIIDESTAVDEITEVRVLTRSRREYRRTAALIDRVQ